MEEQILKLKIFYKLSLISTTLTSLLLINNVAAHEILKPEILTFQGNNVYLLKLPKTLKVRPVVYKQAKSLVTILKDNKALAVINGGFFNYSDFKPVSKIFVDSKPVTFPSQNKALINNPKLKNILNNILDNRSEIRVLSKDGKIFYDISENKTPLPYSYNLLHSLQAGPKLLPDLDLVSEGFVAFKKGKLSRDSIGAFSKNARSGLCITNDNSLWFFINQTQKGGLTISELKELTVFLKCKQINYIEKIEVCELC